MSKTLLIILAAGVFLTACHSIAHLHSSNTNQEQQARRFFLKGQAFLQNKERIQAEIYFRKALKVLPEFAPAWDGLGRVYLERNDLERAEEFVRKALPSWVPAFITLSRIEINRGEYELALENLKIAHKRLSPQKFSSLNKEILILKIRALVGLQKWSEAQKIVMSLAKKNPDWQAVQNLKQKILSHFTVTDSLPSELRGFYSAQAITRGQVATLIHKLFLKDSFPQPPAFLTRFDPQMKLDSIKDIDPTSETFTAIQSVLRGRLMWGFPDHRFMPRAFMPRGAFAIVLQRIYLAYHVFDNLKPYCKVEDVPVGHPAHGAVCFCLQKGLLKTEKGKFFLRKPVTGKQAVQALLKLKRLVVNSALPADF